MQIYEAHRFQRDCFKSLKEFFKKSWQTFFPRKDLKYFFKTNIHIL